MKTLICTPDIRRKGGVANLFAILKKYFSSDVDYFTMGSRTLSHGRTIPLWRLHRDYRNFHRKLASTHYDVVHLNPSLAPKAILRDGLLLLMAKKTRCKVVVFLHGWDESFERALRRRYGRLFRYVYSKADAFVVLSSQFKDKLVNMGLGGSIHVATTAIDDDFCVRAWETVNREEGNTKQQKFNILFLGRVERSKGIYEAVDAYGILKTRFPFLNLVVAGDGRELPNVRDYVKAKRIENICFTGYIRNEAKEEALRGAHLYLFPTMHGEGLPITIVEAMSYGLPVVTRPVGGIRDFFEEGRMGFTTVSRNPVVFASLMERLILDGDSAKRIGEYNRRYVEEHFKASHLSHKIEAIYRDVLEV